MKPLGAQTILNWAFGHWRRWRESVVLAPLAGISWRRLHSPMLFLWARALQSNARHWPKQVEPQTWRVEPARIEQWRQALLSDSSMLVRTDLGAGSRGLTTHEVAIQTRRLAQRSLTPERDVHALCRWLRCIGKEGRFLELGTSLGVTAAYVASAGWSVETWEGCPQTLMKAQEGWRLMGLDAHVQSKQDAFQNLLAGLTSEQAWDVIYVDGCHEEHATLHMVDILAKHALVAIVLDDIAWSSGMHRAWEKLKQRPEWRVTMSWRGRGFLIKAPHMASQHHALA